nr:hypothetical protein [Micromonospora sp. DSM 115978]
MTVTRKLAAIVVKSVLVTALGIGVAAIGTGGAGQGTSLANETCPADTHWSVELGACVEDTHW